MTGFKQVRRDAFAAARSASRVGWIDCVKGLTIILVVAHHTLLGLEAKGLASAEALRWNETLATLRMPLFFMVAGLFARRAIEGPFRKFLDGKVIHFAYFYLLWSLIQFCVRFSANGVANKQTGASEIATILWDPISTIWFMYGLALTFVFVRLCRGLSPKTLIAAAFLIQTAALASPPIPGAVILNKFDHLLLYFVLGLYGSEWIRAMAKRATPAIAGVLMLTFLALAVPATLSETLAWPFVFTAVSLAGCAAVIAMAAVTDGTLPARLLAKVGEYSLAIYLLHFLPVAAIRIALTRLGFSQPALLYVCCIVGSVALGILADRGTRATPLSFLFARPRWARLGEPTGSVQKQAGEA